MELQQKSEKKPELFLVALAILMFAGTFLGIGLRKAATAREQVHLVEPSSFDHRSILEIQTDTTVFISIIETTIPSEMPLFPVHLNGATQKELETLPGIGPAKATAILAWRQEHGNFTDLRQLLEIKGIGEKVFAALLSFIEL